MKRKIRTRVFWRKDRPLEMAGKARGTVTAMTDNDNFKTPDVPLADIAQGATRTELAWANRKNGPLAKDELDTAADELDTMLIDQGDYVSKIANGNVTIIHSAGFESTQDKLLLKSATPETPEAPVCTPMPGGAMKVSVKGKQNVSCYQFLLVVDGVLNVTVLNGQLTIPAGSNTLVISSTKRSVVFTGLTSLKTVQVAAVTVNAAGTSGISPVSSSSTIV